MTLVVSSVHPNGLECKEATILNCQRDFALWDGLSKGGSIAMHLGSVDMVEQLGIYFDNNEVGW